jgi:hypothetical protein
MASHEAVEFGNTTFNNGPSKRGKVTSATAAPEVPIAKPALLFGPKPTERALVAVGMLVALVLRGVAEVALATPVCTASPERWAAIVVTTVGVDLAVATVLTPVHRLFPPR